MPSSVSPEHALNANATHHRSPAQPPRYWHAQVHNRIVKLSNAWLSAQLTTYGGKYSIERTLALEEYIQRTPLSRVVGICLAVPVMLILFVLGQEAIPLQDPREGWSANYGFWVRVFLLGGAVGYASATYLGYMIDGAKLSPRQLVVFVAGVAISYSAVNVTVAAWLVFPIPFLAFSTNIFVMFILTGLFRAIIGASAFREVVARRGQLLPFKNFVLVQMFMLVLYPVFQILFGLATNTRWELPVLLILPVMKLVMKNIMVRTIRHREDMIPEEVIFIVDFFDALYMATFMQNASSTTSIIGIVIAHLIQTAVELHEMCRKTDRIFTRLARVTGNEDRNLFIAAATLCQKLKTEIHAGVQVYSSVPHQISTANNLLLEALDCRQKSVSTTDYRHTHSREIHAVQKVSSSLTQIHPATSKPVVQTTSINTWVSRSTASYSSAKRQSMECLRLLHEVTEVFFTSECLILTEFLETVVPILYGSYIRVMVGLPSAKYHSEMAHVTQDNVSSVVQGIFIYGLLEWLSGAVVTVIMYRNCGIRALHQFAFVMETQMHLVQAKLVIYIMITLTYRVVHFGR